MQAIASSAREQSTGLSEVNSAINQMDQTTKQNAAMVEESTAASASLAQEAENLRHTVSGFQLSATQSRSNAELSVRRAASPETRVASPQKFPARPMTAKRASAFQGNAAVASDSWEEF
jgi:methyl-accepting chemotaxis protein